MFAFLRRAAGGAPRRVHSRYPPIVAVSRPKSGRFPFSNFEPVDGLELDGVPYPTAEHLFQALKTDDPSWRERIRTAAGPGRAKRLGRLVPLREYWDELRDVAMRTVLRREFALKPFRSRLLAWEGPIVERTTRHDTYWGTCSCPRHGGRGENRFGQLLEELRAELLAAEAPVPPARPA